MLRGERKEELKGRERKMDSRRLHEEEKKIRNVKLLKMM